MKYCCSFSSCNQIPQYSCFSEESINYYCSSHLKSLNLMDSPNYEVFDTTKSVESNDKQHFIDILIVKINENKLISEKLNQSLDSLIKLHFNIIKSLKNQIKYFKKLLFSVLKTMSVFYPAKQRPDQEPKNLSLDNINEIIHSIEEESNYKKYLAILKKFNINLEDLGKNPRFSSINLYGFKEKSNIIISYNTRNQEKYSIKIPNLEPQGYAVTICEISDEKLFIYGGHRSNDSQNLARYVELNTMTVRKLPPGISRSYASGEIVEKRVYIFGGYNKSAISDSHYFNLISEKWQSITSLPSPNFPTSTTLVRDSILISGCTNNLLARYIIETNSYERLNDEVQIPSSHVLVQFKETVFLLTSEDTYFSDVFDLLVWKKVRASNKCFNKSTTIKPIVRGNNAFFALNSLSVLCFNCVDFSLNIVM